MDMMQLLEMLKQQAGQNQPLLPASNPLGGDEWINSFPSNPQSNGLPPRNRSDIPAPAPMPAPAPQGPDMMGPQELVGPTRDLAGPMGIGAFEQAGPPVSAEQLLEIETPDREKKSGLVDKPFYKDNDRMAMMAAALSDGFGGMTLRGKSGMGTLNKLTMANAQKNIKDNKTMDYMVQNNPEMAKKLMQLPPEFRDKYMDLAMRSSFGDIGSDTQGTANIRDYLFRQGLGKEDQAAWDNMNEPGEKMVTTPNGAVIAVKPNGDSRMVLSSEQANQMAASGADAKAGGVAAGDELRQMYKTARYAQDNLDGLQRTRDKLVATPDGGGIFQPYKQFFDRVKTEFGSIEGAANATNEQLLEMEGVERTMQWFLSSGLGARGLDTPAEFMQWLKLNGGDLTMTRDASIAFIDRAMDRTMRDAERYNAAIIDPLYSDVDKIGEYKPSEYTDPRQQAQTQPEDTPPAIAEGKTEVVGGVTYVYRNGQWFQQ